MIKLIVFIAGLFAIGVWFKKPLSHFWIKNIRPWLAVIDCSADSVVSGDSGLTAEDMSTPVKKEEEKTQEKKEELIKSTNIEGV